MKWAYDLTGAEPIIKDELVYDGTAIQNGELLMLGAAAFSAGTDAGVSLVSAAPDTVGANAAVNAFGICLESKNTAGNPNGGPVGSNVNDGFSIATAQNVTTGNHQAAKVIINPMAVYRAEMYTASASALAASATSAKITVTGVAAATMDGAYVYFQSTAGAAKGNLRMVVASATAGSLLLDAATSTLQTTADTVLFIGQKNRFVHNISGGSSTVIDAIYTISQTVGFAGTNLRIVENYIDRGSGLEILRYNTHRQTSGLPATTKFHQDVMMIDHIWGQA